MAVATINEKLALISYQQPWNTPIPISADGLGSDDKKHLIAQYPGSTWGVAAPSVTRRGFMTLGFSFRAGWR